MHINDILSMITFCFYNAFPYIILEAYMDMLLFSRQVLVIPNIFLQK